MEYVTKSRAAIKDVAELLARGEDKEEVCIDTRVVDRQADSRLYVTLKSPFFFIPPRRRS